MNNSCFPFLRLGEHTRWKYPPSVRLQLYFRICRICDFLYFNPYSPIYDKKVRMLEKLRSALWAVRSEVVA